MGDPGSTGYADELPGSIQIAGYGNLVEISRGGQGIVYRAVHALTKRKVAIKMLLRGAYATARELHRFEREIEIVAALRHANIVTVFDSGVTADQRPFVVMEYIHGLPLDKYVRDKLSKASKRSRWMYEPHLRLFAKVAAGVQHAHSRGVIHRDLKPGNILVDEVGEPHIVDFGMARSLSLARGPTPTMTHEFGGTLAYASPEQVGGDPDRIDVRTDVYSLGVIVYELLTGTYPYSISGSISEIVRNIEHTEPAAPTSIEPHIGGEVETIILKALAKEPERRYQSAGELARDIDDFLAGKPISARSDSAWYLVRKMARRNKGSVVAGTIVASLVVVAAGAAHVADREAMRSRGAQEATMRIFAPLDFAKGNVTPRDRFRDLLDAGEKEIGAIFTGSPADEAKVREYVGNGYYEIEEHRKSETQYLRLLELRERAGAPMKDTAGLRLQLARLCAAEGRMDDAQKYLPEDLVAKVRGLDEPVLHAEVLRVLGTFKAMSDPAAAIRLLEEACTVAKGAPGGESELECAKDALAGARLANGELARALELYNDVLTSTRRRLGDMNVRTATLVDSVADCELGLGRSADALAHYKEADAVYRRFIIPPDPRLANSLRQLELAARAAGQDEEAGRYKTAHDEMRRAVEAASGR